MEPVIRSVEERDADAIHAILTSPHVVAGSMRVPLTPSQQTRDRIAPRLGLYQLAAEADGQVVGFAELVTEPDQPRHSHVGEINIVATHADWLGKGVGRALMEAMIDLADNWLNLAPLTLIVFTDNEHAIGLYERLGFEHEGTMRRAGFGSGAWMHAHVMGRLRD